MIFTIIGFAFLGDKPNTKPLRKPLFSRKRRKAEDKIQKIHGDKGENDPSGDPNPEDPIALLDGQCPYCFVNPCVATSNRNAPWIGNGQPPSNQNPQVRKGIYRRFWKCINNLNGWQLQQYIQKKIRIGGNEGIVYHQREIMPECVLELVRGLYPNPKGVPYLGHMWE